MLIFKPSSSTLKDLKKEMWKIQEIISETRDSERINRVQCAKMSVFMLFFYVALAIGLHELIFYNANDLPRYAQQLISLFSLFIVFILFFLCFFQFWGKDNSIGGNIMRNNNV